MSAETFLSVLLWFRPCWSSMDLLVARGTCETDVHGVPRMPRGRGNETMNRVGQIYQSSHFYGDAFTVFRVIKSTQYTKGLSWHRKKYGPWDHSVIVIFCEDEDFVGQMVNLSESFMWSWKSRRSDISGMIHADAEDPPEPWNPAMPELDFSEVPKIISTFEKYNTRI